MLEMLWPGGLTRALTFSYDDGVLQDLKLLKLMKRYGLKGTFNLNSGMFAGHNHIPEHEIGSAYEGFEVAVHSVTHPDLRRLSAPEVLNEVLNDRKKLERLVGYPVRGMAYPGGYLDDHVVELIRCCGIVYARTVATTDNFSISPEPLRWACSCHHDRLAPLVDGFLRNGDDVRLLSVWGHSYEFDRVENGWKGIEAQMEKLSGHCDVWYCTNIEMFDYCDAFQRLEYSVDGSLALNRSALEISVRSDRGNVYLLKPGSCTKLNERNA